MKIRTKLLVTFCTITVVPIILIYIAIMGLSTYQNRVFSETYGVGQVDLSAGASIRVFSHLTESIQKEIEEEIKNDPSDFEDLTYLATLNDQMKCKAFLFDGDERMENSSIREMRKRHRRSRARSRIMRRSMMWIRGEIIWIRIRNT